MSEVVVDTSVAFKWFVSLGENGADEATALLAAHRAGETTMIAPASLPLELANGLRYSGVHREDVLALAGGFHLMHIDLFELTSLRLRIATELAYEHEISVYDAVFLALAHERECPLATADRRAFAKAQTGVEVRLV